ncbi:MAG TPA: C4-dicarboxylate ABC transporter permease [Deltaproteobacteria bacterium]|nr:C4-dicarboxylate ABC transporter permease [Deltaproteobacteria bacterium]
MSSINMVIPILIFVVLLVLRVHIAICFAVAGIIGTTLIRGFDSSVTTLGLAVYSETSNYILLSIPLFVAMGDLLFFSGISSLLYEFAFKWAGKMRGSLAYATIIACTAFGACTGSSMAAVGTLGPVALREMENYNYKSSLAYGCITSASSLGIMIPPSLAFIIYGYICAVPIGPLFIAGILPGILVSLALMAQVFIMLARNPGLAPISDVHFTFKEKMISLVKVSWVVILFIVIVGGLTVGIFTATEAAGIGAFVTFIMLVVTKRISWKVLTAALKNTAKTSCMIFTIIIGAKVFNTFLGLTGLPGAFTEYMGNLPVSRYLVLSLILFCYIPLGCFIDSIPMFLLTLPVIYPVIEKLGFDPLLFGVLITLVAQISLLTPPVGMNVYVLSGVSGRPLGDCFAGSAPFLIPMTLCVIILVAFPQISLFLPGLLK